MIEKRANICYFCKFEKPNINEYLFVIFEHYNNLCNDNVAKFNFEQLFLWLDHNTRHLLDDIYLYSDKDITVSTFISYVTKHNIKLPIMEEEYYINGDYQNQTISFTHSDSQVSLNSENFGNKTPSQNRKKLFNITPKSSLSLKIKDLFSYVPNTHVISMKKLYYSNQQEFLIAFMNWVLSADNKLKIRKCKICKRYFVASNGNNIYCNNIRKTKKWGQISCVNYSALFKSTTEYRQFKYEEKLFNQRFSYCKDYKNLPLDYEKNFKNTINNIVERAMELDDVNLLVNFVSNYEKEHPFK